MGEIGKTEFNEKKEGCIGRMKTIDVAGAVLMNEKGEILCALRSQKMSSPGLWEFPGGKIEAGETPQQCLKREIQEELDVEIEVGELVEEVVYGGPMLKVHLLTYYGRVITGTPRAKEHERLDWRPVEELSKLLWAPADVPTVNNILKRFTK